MSAALRLLALRGRSEAELTHRLQQKGFSAETIAACLQRCRELGYVNDRQFADDRARILLGQGRAVGPRLLAELRRSGIDETLAREALDKADAEIDADRVLTQMLERRFPGFDYQNADDRQRRRIIHFFMRRGFSLDRILDAVKQKG